MLKYFVILLILISAKCTISQELSYNVPDYKKIETAISNQESKFYYPALFARYCNNDTTLTVDNYYYLYYGYSLREEYLPYQIHDSLIAFNNYLSNDTITAAEFGYIAGLGVKMLEKLPFNTMIIKWVSIALYESGNIAESEAYRKKYTGICNVILDSGDGKNDSTAFHVISVTDEYEILRIYKLRLREQSLVASNGRSFDAMAVVDENDKEDVVYFDVTKLLQSTGKMLKK